MMVLPYELTEIKQPEGIMHTLDAMTQIIWAKELKQLLGCGTHRIYALMKCPAFPSTQLGSRYFVEKEALRQWLISYRGKKIIL